MWFVRQGLLGKGLTASPVPCASAAGARCRQQTCRARAFAGAAAHEAASNPAGPTSADLLRDSKLAAVSGLAYCPSEELSMRLQSQGMQLQAQGNTSFTRWFVARPADAGAASGSPGLPGHAAQQYIFFRGVSWRSADLDALRVWQGLMRALPSPFLPHLTSSPELLMAHSGVAEMAEELYSVLRPHMEGQGQLHLAGHSLGGSLATLVALTAHLRLGGSTSASAASLNDRQQQQQQQLSPQGQQQQQQQQQRRRLQVTCTTFGSPPVLAMSQGEGEDGRSILQAARMPPGAVRNYVLQDDPVPRALLSADPAFLALQQNTAVAGLLRLRERWLGQGVLSPTRFLFHPAGDVFLIRWTAEAGHSVRLLAPHTLQEELKLDVAAMRSSPLAMMQAVLDHHHGSYASELRAAAATQSKLEGGAVLKPAAAPGAATPGPSAAPAL
ncbi:hypothetical protein D9Q98_005987 [Chlorella vulgaris]|uniref:Fungal lipase-type domain-containing protein n=1 Tax=Chlorella vulgaris TaxID=3077 RepID=A0A9D4TWR4_CHLVU|nr:hypothetical protein D9Q98_005987 [Chlorella vulgaris]